jgi:hypothetical protein
MEVYMDDILEGVLIKDLQSAVALSNGDYFVVSQPGIQPNGSTRKITVQVLREALGITASHGNYPIGSGYTQGINDPDPIDLGLLGQWELWTHRAEAYRLINGPFLNTTLYTAGNNYAAGAYVKYHLPGSGHELWKAKAAITNAAVQLNPVLWEKVEGGIVVERRYLQGWLDADRSLGACINGGEYDGMYVAEVIALGGTFPSYEGGNRPTYLSGVAGDAIRNVIGDATSSTSFVGYASPFVAEERNVFYRSSYEYENLPGNVGQTRPRTGFDLSRQVPTGPDNAPRTLSSRYWRRVA